jgi:hypothetical protein
MNDCAGDRSLPFVDDVDVAEQAFRHDIDGIWTPNVNRNLIGVTDGSWIASLPCHHGHHPLAAVRGICYHL